MEHIKRMEVELSELKDKSRKAGEFWGKEITNPKFLNSKQTSLLGMQVLTMEQYITILESRIQYEKELLKTKEEVND